VVSWVRARDELHIFRNSWNIARALGLLFFLLDGRTSGVVFAGFVAENDHTLVSNNQPAVAFVG
jgi:hypothetical protein